MASAATALNWTGIIHELLEGGAPPRRVKFRHTGVDAMWRGLAQLDDASALIARILLSELGQNGLDFPLLQTKVIPSTTLLAYAPVRSAAAALRPDHYLREKIEILKKARLDGPNGAAGPVPASGCRGESALLDIVEVREWLHRRNSPTTLAWIVRPGQWTYWGLTMRERATLGLTFEASLDSETRATAELTLVLGHLIGLTILPNSPANQLSIRLQTLLDAGSGIFATATPTDATVQALCTQCFNALGALERAGVISQMTFPAAALQQSAGTHPDLQTLTVAVSKPTKVE